MCPSKEALTMSVADRGCSGQVQQHHVINGSRMQRPPALIEPPNSKSGVGRRRTSLPVIPTIHFMQRCSATAKRRWEKPSTTCRFRPRPAERTSLPAGGGVSCGGPERLGWRQAVMPRETT